MNIFFFFYTSVNLKTLNILHIIHAIPSFIGLFFFASFNQFWVQIRASTVLRDSKLWNESKTTPPPSILKVDSDATVETEIANTSQAI